MVRVGTYNVQDFDELFDTDNTLLTDAETVARLGHLQTIFDMIDADIIGMAGARVVDSTRRAPSLLSPPGSESLPGQPATTTAQLTHTAIAISQRTPNPNSID